MDGLPTVLLEALAAGLPILATPISGITELILDKVTGLLCDAAPSALATAIKNFYELPDTQVEAMIEAGISVVGDRFSLDRQARVLQRVWRDETIDIVIVAWNNLPELSAVIERLYKFTTLPFHLIVCDNNSSPDVKAYLSDLWREKGNLTVIHNSTNLLVGPGTNIALGHGWSDIVIYVCGKEGLAFRTGWEIPFVHVMAEQEEVGLCGNLCHSPTYLYGHQYPTGIKEFSKFRNPQFAQTQADRPFHHVQGGIFAFRRKMVTEIERIQHFRAP